MLNQLYDTIFMTMLTLGGIGIVLGIGKGIANNRARSIPKCEKYTVEVEITDPMLVSEIETLERLQEVYNAQIAQQNERLGILQCKYDKISAEIQEQVDEMEYTSHLGDTKVNGELYKSKIDELSEIRNVLMGQMLKIEEKILKLGKQSDGVTTKLDNIALKEYKRQNL